MKKIKLTKTERTKAITEFFVKADIVWEIASIAPARIKQPK